MMRRKLTVLITMLSLSFVLSGCGLIDIILAEPIGARLDAACAAAPFEVTKTEDTYDALCTSGDCSLREAVFTANECEGAQEIHLEDEVYELTRMDPGDYEDPNAAGRLVLTESATIIGNGGIVDGQDTMQVFQLRLEATEQVVFQDLTIQNGLRETAAGGGLAVSAGAAELRNVTVRNNQAGSDTYGVVGGGIVVGNEASLSLVGSTVAGNRVYGEGGGIAVYTNGNMTMDPDSVVADNQALDGYSGGGIMNDGTATIAGTVRDNSASWVGGGIRNAGSMELTDVEIFGNIAPNAGGGVANTGELRMTGGTIRNNQANDGAGLAAFSDPDSSTGAATYLVDTALSGNRADFAGGGIYSGGNALLVATRADVRGNRASRGAGVFAAGESFLLSSTLADNIAAAQEGGGLWVGGRMGVTGSTLSGNEAPGSSGVYLGASAIWVDEGASLSVLNSTVSGNDLTSGQGAAIFNRRGLVTAEHITVSDNSSPAFSGLLGSVSDINLEHSIVVGNGIDVSCSQPISTKGFNLFDNPDCGPDPSLGDILIGSASEAGLQALADYGGPTQTHALAPDSPAVDGVEEGCPAPDVDQRGEARPVAEFCDIGAFEGTATAAGGAMTPTPLAAEIDVNFNADLYTIERGQCTTLRWRVSGASSISLLGQEVEAAGADEVCPDETTGYTLLAQNDADEVSEYLEIAVTEPTDDTDLSCLHRYPNENQPKCYEVCPVDNPNPGGSCTP